MKQQKQSIENSRYFFIGILLLIQINAFSLGTLPKETVFNLHQQDTLKKNETICYEFKLINNSDTILHNIGLTDYFISNAQCFHLSTNVIGNLQVSEQSFNPLTTNLNISHIPIGHSSFSLEIDVSSDLLSKSNFYKNLLNCR